MTTRGARVVLVLVVVLVYAAASNARWWHRARAWRAAPVTDEITAYERRFDRLRPLLPARGVVGYLGDPDPEAAALLHFRRYLLAQYTLAPLLLVESLDPAPDLVIGNFEPGTMRPSPPGLARVRDLGDGVVLFRRAAP